MTVGELRAKLAEVPDDKIVLICEDMSIYEISSLVHPKVVLDEVGDDDLLAIPWSLRSIRDDLHKAGDDNPYILLDVEWG